MTAGDRFFGPNVATGEVVGTGWPIQVPLSFSPQSVEILNRDTGAVLKWDKTMPQDSGILISGGTASLTITTETLSPQAATFFWIDTATGNFTVAETVTGALSGATGVVAVANTDNQDDLGLTGIVGNFEVGETITGGTSGETAIVRSGAFSVYVPAVPVGSFYGAIGSANIGLVPNGNALNATMVVTYSTLVGTFQVGELVSGGTSANVMVVLAVLPGVLIGAQVEFNGGAGMALGETITGATSAATAVVTSSEFDRTIAYRPPSQQWANGRFAIFSPVNLLGASITVTYVGTNAISGTTTVAYIATGGVTSGNSGFIIGQEPNINFPASVIYFEATR